MSPSQKGAIAEIAVAAAAMRLGIRVMKPLDDGGRYDLVFDAGGRLLRVQCKWATATADVVSIPTRTSRHSAQHGYTRTTYGSDEVDGIAAYCETLDECYWLPIERFAGQSYVHLRLRPARNNQRLLVNWARDYPLGAIAQLGERLHGMQEVAGSSPASSTPAKPLF